MSMNTLSKAAFRILCGTAIILFIGMCGLVLLQVIARKFFEPLVWSEELARYIFIWVAFLGWVIATRHKSHIRISFIHDHSPPKGQLVLDLLSNVAVIIFSLIFAINGWRLMQNNLDIETVTLFFNFWVVYLVIPISATASILIACFDMIALFQGHSSSKEIQL